MNIEITNLTDSNCEQERLVSVANHAMQQLDLHQECELSISLVDEDEMTALHVRWMDEPGSTDVLSFPMDEVRPNSANTGPGMLGDIILCPDFAARQAAQLGHSLQQELELLTVHGVLHLVGYDHREAEEKAFMFDLQDKYLSEWRSQQ
ncbi:MAG: rRNA maturation RNase YbeY [Candidatus Nanopelagicaceae bacterium]|nr:rRNA maturation RNase YbeY [Candidatus Nanopelagicaceae bacterium]